MKDITAKINESNLEAEMELWERRMKEPYGQELKNLQCQIIDLKLFPTEKNEWGLYTFTPFDHYITAYALDGNKKYTYNAIKAVCDNYDYSQYKEVAKCLRKLEKLAK